ncbi:MAG: hypothetical protein ACOX15_09215 [Tepidanaerobacteraceae bacterium]
MKHILVLVLLLIMILICGCGSGVSENNDYNSNENQTEAGDPSADPDLAEEPEEENQAGAHDGENETTLLSPSIGGIHLGHSKEQVIMILGDEYNEIICEEQGYYGEEQVIMEYDSGISVIIGLKSSKVLDVTTESPDFPTDRGSKVGDNADEVLAKYRQKYEEFESVYADGKNIGWFVINDEVFLIFDFDKDDGMLLNETVDDESKVELIKLAYMMHFD